MTQDDRHVAYVDGHQEPCVDFDHSKIDQSLGWVERAATPPDAGPDYTQGADGLCRILHWIWGRNSNPKTAIIRLSAMTFGLRRDALLPHETIESMADKIGTKKQNISEAMRQLEQRFDLRIVRHRSSTGRANMSRAQAKQWALK